MIYHILTIYYDIENNKFYMEQISETGILDSLLKNYLVPEDILILIYMRSETFNKNIKFFKAQ